MTHDRYVVLGLGRARSDWFGSVSLWATSGSIPVDFAKCLSVSEVRHRIGSAQPYSALVVEAGIAGLDRDLIEAANRAGAPTIVIDRIAERADQWRELGAADVLSPNMSPSDFMNTLSLHARLISGTGEDVIELGDDKSQSAGRLVAVCGPGGTGASTIAIALAQGFGDDVLQSDLVVLADFARNGEQAMLHDTNDIVPGVEELVDAHRKNRPTTEELRELTFNVPARRYRLLLGQRRSHSWTTMPIRATTESILALRRAFRTVVCDVTADFEGEDDGGSMDVEERNGLARASVSVAQAVVVVGAPGMKGIHSLARTIRDLIRLGIPKTRIIAVINRAPKSPLARKEQLDALAALTELAKTHTVLTNVVFVSERNVDSALRDNGRLPKQVVDPVLAAVQNVLNLPAESTQELHTAIAPGSLGILDEAI